jgi:hypothetical protein
MKMGKVIVKDEGLKSIKVKNRKKIAYLSETRKMPLPDERRRQMWT